MEKVSKNKKKKVKTVSLIADKIKKSKSIVFVDYRGLNVATTTALRAEMRKEGIDYKVYKNTLVERALNECGITELNGQLKNTLAVAFGYEDETAPARILKSVIDKTKKMELKFGVVNGSVLDGAQVKELAVIPSKNVLIAKLLYVLNSPLSKLAFVLNESVKNK